MRHCSVRGIIAAACKHQRSFANEFVMHIWGKVKWPKSAMRARSTHNMFGRMLIIVINEREIREFRVHTTFNALCAYNLYTFSLSTDKHVRFNNYAVPQAVDQMTETYLNRTRVCSRQIEYISNIICVHVL